MWCSDRRGGVSAPPFDSCNVGDHVGDDPAAVAENRARLAKEIGSAPEDWVWLRQVHGTHVHVATAPPAGDPPDSDAVITSVRGLVLAILTADCAPVMLACDDAIGAVHAGHRGLEQRVIETAVEALRAIGRGPVRAYIGPCIRPSCYEFGEADLARLRARLGPDVAGRTSDGRPAFDLPAAARGALARSGVTEIGDSGVCTSESPLHFSYRRDGRTGRQATIVVFE